MILAMFLNTAVDQQLDLFKKERGRAPTPAEHEEIYDRTLATVRGTVSGRYSKRGSSPEHLHFFHGICTEAYGRYPRYFIQKNVRNYYSFLFRVITSLKPGANPISQLAFTLANGFTYVEYYLARGMKIDDFAPNLSFFFSNGVDAEYGVIGRVARRIWAVQ